MGTFICAEKVFIANQVAQLFLCSLQVLIPMLGDPLTSSLHDLPTFFFPGLRSCCSTPITCNLYRFNLFFQFFYLSETCHLECSVLNSTYLLTSVFATKPFILLPWYVLSWDKTKGHSFNLSCNVHYSPEIKHTCVVPVPKHGPGVWPWRSCLSGPPSPQPTTWSQTSLLIAIQWTASTFSLRGDHLQVTDTAFVIRWRWQRTLKNTRFALNIKYTE